MCSYQCLSNHDLQVSENGVFSFDEPWMFSHPSPFPTTNVYIRNRLVVAPFWSDNDIRKEGTVRYAFITPKQSSKGDKLIDEVVSYVLNQLKNIDRFEATWLLLAQWEKVHPSPHGADDTNGIPQSILDKVHTSQL